MNKKFCPNCKKKLSRALFGNAKNRHDGCTQYCKKCGNTKRARYVKAHPERVKAAGQRYRTRHPEKFRGKDLQSRYGITLDQYIAILVSQNNVCAICRQPETMTLRGRLKRLAVDHCHTTDRVRGLLCHKCNLAVGQMDDSAVRLRAAAAYLENTWTTLTTRTRRSVRTA